MKPPIFSNWIPGTSLLLAVLLLGLFVWGGNQPQVLRRWKKTRKTAPLLGCRWPCWPDLTVLFVVA